MARIHKEKRDRGVYQRLLVVVEGVKKRISLGYDHDERTLNKLEFLAGKLESLHQVGERPDASLTKGLSVELLSKFAEVGLIQEPPPKLAAFWAAYVENKIGLVGEHTAYKLGNTAKLLLAHFGDVRLADVTAADASGYAEARKKSGKADATVKAEINQARQFFKQAINRRYLTENPFAEVKVIAEVDESRKQVIDAGVLESVIDATPCPDWRVFVALMRWTGCRQSEALVLKWEDVLWGEDRIRMPSPKLAHRGKSFRLVPLFAELKPYLLEARNQADDHSVYVVDRIIANRQRSGRQGKNLRKPFQEIIRSAGKTPWPKPFQNLRVTRENELERQYPPHVVQTWIGHTRRVAEKNYLTVTEDDFAKAVDPSGGQIVVSKPTHPTAPATKKGCDPHKKKGLQPCAAHRDFSQNGLAPPAGLEPATRRLTAACSTN